jgi:hypothetical protein
MALGSGATLHRKRLKAASKDAHQLSKEAMKYAKQGKCTPAYNALMAAALHAGTAFANDVAIRRKRKKRLHLGKQTDVKAVYAAKKHVAAACSVASKKAR